MKKSDLICYIACIGIWLGCHDAMAQRIPDLSLPPEDITQQPGTFENDVTRRNDAITPPPPSGAAQLPRMMDDNAPPKSFMDGYCDPDFVPILANNAKYFGQEQCLKQIRDNACGRFKELPKEVKKVLDDAIGCLFTNGNGYAVDKYQNVSNDSVACGASYMMRIEMLKKYYNDYYANNALLWLPDDILDTSGRCVNRR